MSELILENLVVGFAGFQTQVIEFQGGQGVLHVAGANGSGKTTLLRCIAGELSPRSGCITINGMDPRHDHRARREVALVPCNPQLPGFFTVDECWRVAAGLRNAPDWDGKKVCRALDLPGSLRLDQASSGQKVRCELLCALAGDPDILLMDETFAHLDQDAQTLVAGWISEWSTTRLVVVSHHGPPPFRANHRLEITADT